MHMHMHMHMHIRMHMHMHIRMHMHMHARLVPWYNWSVAGGMDSSEYRTVPYRTVPHYRVYRIFPYRTSAVPSDPALGGSFAKRDGDNKRTWRFLLLVR